jgi:Ca-activated chloride channel homolog
MKNYSRTGIVNFIILFLFISGFAFCDGLIIVEAPFPYPSGIQIRPRRKTKPAPLPVKYHRVSVDIKNQVATTHIDQVFKNPYNMDLEGTYIFPLPEEAAISEFSMYMDGKKVTGEILEKERARKIYEDIVRKMKDPGLLEYVGRNMFKARIYPIPAKGEKRIELTYQQTLKYDSGMISYSYPLDTERFSPDPIEDVSIDVNIESKIPIKSVYSPSHGIDLKLEKFKAVCGFEENYVKPDKDFLLYYNVSEKDIGLNLMTYKRSQEDGYFMMLVSPGEIEAKPQPKDILFVLDTSGSMRGKKMKQAKEALSFCMDGLNNDDRFNIISFATGVNLFRKKMCIYNPDIRDDALDFVNDMKARGGTNLHAALVQALDMIPESKRSRMIVFLTDGEPTVGLTSTERILENLSGENRSKARIFAFGVGNDVNTILLDKIAEDHRGVPEYVKPFENIEVKVSAFFDKVSEPVLTDIDLDYGKINIFDVYPQELPDLFKGTQMVILGRYKNSGNTAIKLTGYVNEKKKEFVFEDKFQKREKKNEFIPRIWASRKIGYLMSEIRLKGERKELVEEVKELSMEFGIMTPYTSFLVLEDEEAYKREGRTIKRSSGTPVPGMIPGHFNRSQAIRDFAKSSKLYNESKAAGSIKVKESIMESDVISSFKHATSARSLDKEKVKHVGEKTFILKKECWIDSKYKKEMKLREIKYLEDEYFDLLRKYPELGKYLAIASNIIVVHEEIAYRISEKM